MHWPVPIIVMFAAGYVAGFCWLVIVKRLKRIPRPAGYKSRGLLRRYKENFPQTPLLLIIQVCEIVIYTTAAYWIYIKLLHK